MQSIANFDEESFDVESVLKIHKINGDVKHKSIFNLFSIYGLILDISIDTNKSEAFITYSQKDSAQEAIFHLQDINFFNTPL